jgi:hypothetical protein
MGSKHSVNKNGPRAFVPICNSKPWAVVLPAGGNIKPALFVNTSRRVSFDMKSAADLEMVARSARSRERNSSRPLESGHAALRTEMAADPLERERPAMYTVLFLAYRI